MVGWVNDKSSSSVENGVQVNGREAIFESSSGPPRDRPRGSYHPTDDQVPGVCCTRREGARTSGRRTDVGKQLLKAGGDTALRYTL